MFKRAEGLAAAAQISAPGPAAVPAETGSFTAADGAPGSTARPDKDKPLKNNTKKSVYIYIATLFLVVLLFTLLSYFVQQRNNSEISTLYEKNATAQQNIENLQSDNLQLREEKKAGTKEIAALQDQITVLEQQIEDLRQAWLAEVRSIREDDQAAYNALQAQYDALKEENEAEGTEE